MSLPRIIRASFDGLYGRVCGTLALKEFHEFRYWRGRKRAESALDNSWYQGYFTEYFNIDPSFYEGKRVLDIGCGPRGSLEWADMAAERVGLDPLASQYRQLGCNQHAMDYVEAYSEDIPFEDEHFDVVMTMNSLDHVVDVEKTIEEIMRVVRVGGTVLLLVNLDHAPTACEPNSFGIEILDRFSGCEVKYFRRLESPEELHSWHVDYDETNAATRPSGIAARLVRVA